jgi:hypothetical protein
MDARTHSGQRSIRPGRPRRTSHPKPSHVSRRILHLQILTIVWMTVEAGVSLGTAWRSHSPALFAFGGDSLIELLSAAVVLGRFRFELNEARAARIAGVLLFMLAGLVALNSSLNFLGYREAQRSLIGIGLLLACRVCHALACEAETAVGRHHVERGIEGGCGSVCFVRLHGLDCSGRVRCQCDLGNQVGRSRRRLGSHSRSSCERGG